MTDNQALPQEIRLPDKKSTIFDRLPVKWLLLIVASVVLVGWLLNTPAGWLGKADAVGYAVCHQIAERSFQINGQPISLCARCTGMYVGAFLGIGFQLLLGRRRSAWPEKKYLIILGVFFFAFAIDGTNSAAKLFLRRGLLYEPSNILRLLTGTGMGLTMATVILPTFHQTAWKKFSPAPYFHSWGQFSGFTALGFAAAALILTEHPQILLPFTFAGVFGVIALLILLYTMILMVIFRRENVLEHARQLIPWLLGGLILALLHIGLFDLVRYWLTGTWEGFHLTLG